MMVSECICLNGVFKMFLKLSGEMELSLMFPSMLKDVSVQNINGVELFKEELADCGDLFRALISLKEEISFGLKRNWFGENNKNNRPSKNQDLAPKFHNALEILVEATTLAKLLHHKYDNKINEVYSEVDVIDIGNVDRIERVVQNLNFLDVIYRFEEEMKELETIILIPCLLQDVSDVELNAYLKKSSLGIPEDCSLLDIFQFLKTIKNIITIAPNRQNSVKYFMYSDNHASLQLNELHTIISQLVGLCLCVMQKYQAELSKSTGSNENIWNTDVNKSYDAEENNKYYINRDTHIKRHSLNLTY